MIEIKRILKNICLIGQFPPPIHGLSKALETIIKSEHMKNSYNLTHINITNNKKFISHIRKIQKSNADIFYFTISHSMLGNIRDILILKLLLKKQKKIIIHYHGGYYRELYNKMNVIQKMLNRRLLSRVDIVIVLSKKLKSIFSGIVPDNKIRICENFAEEQSIISNQEFEEKMRLLKNKKKINVLYLSNFIKSKGYMEVLESIKELKDLEGKLSFHFAGKFFTKKEKVEFVNFVQQNHLSNVFYHGVVNGIEKKNLMKLSDVFILPTYYHIEGQPISLIEAMANGLTVITTAHAGIPDIVSKKNGYIIPPKNIYEIESAIRELIYDTEKLIIFGKTNREYSLLNFKEIDYIRRLQKIFNEV